MHWIAKMNVVNQTKIRPVYPGNISKNWTYVHWVSGESDCFFEVCFGVFERGLNIYDDLLGGMYFK